ncbi:hypothetical protein, partial [Salmonella enterica]|uniref:hypothetical protein n=1 Tax=Salmonella enterica TaxID=28901 RepID=UPI00352E973A
LFVFFLFSPHFLKVRGRRGQGTIAACGVLIRAGWSGLLDAGGRPYPLWDEDMQFTKLIDSTGGDLSVTGQF